MKNILLISVSISCHAVPKFHYQEKVNLKGPWADQSLFYKCDKANPYTIIDYDDKTKKYEVLSGLTCDFKVDESDMEISK